MILPPFLKVAKNFSLHDLTDYFSHTITYFRITSHYCPKHFFISDKCVVQKKRTLPHKKKLQIPKVCVHSSIFLAEIHALEHLLFTHF